MSDWQVGDLAVCVDDKPFARGCAPTGLVAGGTYRVCGLTAHPDGSLLLVVEAPSVAAGFEHGAPGAHRFRKILPDKHEECEPEFVTLLKRIKIGVSS